MNREEIVNERLNDPRCYLYLKVPPTYFEKFVRHLNSSPFCYVSRNYHDGLWLCHVVYVGNIDYLPEELFFLGRWFERHGIS